MTLHEFSQDVVPILQLLSIAFLWWQIRQAARWGRLTSNYNFINAALSHDIHKSLLEAAKNLDIRLRGRRHALTPDEVEILMGDDAAHAATIAYLNEFENVCTALKHKIADNDVAYDLHSLRVIGEWKVFEPFVRALRKHEKDDLVFIELEARATKWAMRAAREK